MERHTKFMGQTDRGVDTGNMGRWRDGHTSPWDREVAIGQAQG